MSISPGQTKSPPTRDTWDSQFLLIKFGRHGKDKGNDNRPNYYRNGQSQKRLSHPHFRSYTRIKHKENNVYSPHVVQFTNNL